jgi:photosystem II stability/assembly factor-like uncharacterized protein
MKSPTRRLATSVSALLVLAGGFFILFLAGCESDNTVAPIPPGPPLSALVISPATDTLQGSETQQFTAQAYDTLGAPITAPLAWYSTNTNIFTVNTGGLVTGRGEGSANLVVSSGGRSDTAIVYVFPDTGWILQPAGGASLNGVFALADGRNGWAVGDGGRILRTVNAGASWGQEISNTGYNLNGVWFTTSEGWAVGDQSTVLRRTSSGWERMSGANPIGANLNDVVFVDADTGWVAGDMGTIARTFDGGLTWSKLVLPTSFNFNGIARSGARGGYAVGNGGTIAVTHDQGVTWYLVSTPTTQPLTSVATLGANGAIAVGATGTVLRTAAAGPDSLVWQLLVPSAGANNQLEGVHAIGGSLVFAVGTNAALGGTILRSDDGGDTWAAQSSRTSVRLNDVHFIDNQRGWAVGEGGVIVHTARGGN